MAPAARFDTLYREYFQQIYTFVYRLTGDPGETEDITQDSFVKLYHCLQKGTELKDPKAWIFRVACNTGYTRLKTKERHRKLTEEHGETTLPLQGNPAHHGIDVQLMEKEDMNRVRAAFVKLPVQDRLILELYQSGLSYLEIARVVKVKQSTVGKKLFRARNKLARQIKGEDR